MQRFQHYVKVYAIKLSSGNKHKYTVYPIISMSKQHHVCYCIKVIQVKIQRNRNSQNLYKIFVVLGLGIVLTLIDYSKFSSSFSFHKTYKYVVK